LRIEADHRYFFEQIPAYGLENLLENARIEKKRRTPVKSEALGPDRRGTPAYERLTLQNGHFKARMS
jgi:hypothetical protein